MRFPDCFAAGLVGFAWELGHVAEWSFEYSVDFDHLSDEVIFALSVGF